MLHFRHWLTIANQANKLAVAGLMATAAITPAVDRAGPMAIAPTTLAVILAGLMAIAITVADKSIKSRSATKLDERNLKARYPDVRRPIPLPSIYREAESLLARALN